MISGSVIAETNFPANGQVIAIPEFLSWQRYNDVDMQSLGRVCEVLDPMEGQMCGYPGAYGFNIDIVLPYKEETWYQQALDSVTSISIHFHNKFTCQQAKVSHNEETRTSHNLASHNLAVAKQVSGLVGVGVAFGVLFAVWYRKRHRGDQQQNECDEESDDQYDDQYLEMGPQPNGTSSLRATDPVVQWRRRDSVIDANEILDQQRVIYGDNMDQYRSRV